MGFLKKLIGKAAPIVGGLLGGPIGAAAGSLVGGMIGGDEGDVSQNPQQAQRAVDPFSQYRDQYAQQLNTLMQDPSSVSSLPGYEAMMGAGQQAVQRGLSATGQVSSGREQIALEEMGRQQQYGYFQDQFGRLSQLSGAASSPYSGGMAAIAASNNANQTQGQMIGGIANIFGNKDVQDKIGSTISGIFGRATQEAPMAPAYQSSLYPSTTGPVANSGYQSPITNFGSSGVSPSYYGGYSAFGGS